jgi:hypothetical protein
MYLIHDTTPYHLDQILVDGALKSSKLTKNADDGYGYGLYASADFVYCSTTDKLFDPDVYGCTTIYLDSATLRPRQFYVANFHIYSSPHIPEERMSTERRIPRMLYTRTYPKFFGERDRVLSDLCRESKMAAPAGMGFHFMNQVAVRDHLDIRAHIRGVSINSQSPWFDKETLCAYLQYFIKTFPTIPVCVVTDPTLDKFDMFRQLFVYDHDTQEGGAPYLKRAAERAAERSGAASQVIRSEGKTPCRAR